MPPATKDVTGVSLPAYLITPDLIKLGHDASTEIGIRIAYFLNGNCDFCSGGCAIGVAILGA